MMFIISQPPNFCPNCGNNMSKIWRGNNSDDFYAHAAHSCSTCNAHFQYVNATMITLTAQEAGGDMGAQS